MKTQLLLMAVLGSLLAGCSQGDQSVDELLKDEGKRSEIMEAITNDHEMTMALLDHLLKSEHALVMMRSSHELMDALIGGEGMEVVHLVDHVLARVAKDSATTASFAQMVVARDRLREAVMKANESM